MHEHSEADQESLQVERKCQICGHKKPTDDFYWSQGKRMTRCKECHKGYVKIWRKHHREQVLAHRKKYNAKYRERQRETDSQT